MDIENRMENAGFGFSSTTETNAIDYYLFLLFMNFSLAKHMVSMCQTLWMRRCHCSDQIECIFMSVFFSVGMPFVFHKLAARQRQNGYPFSIYGLFDCVPFKILLGPFVSK